MSIRGQYREILAEITVDGCRLCRRFYNEKIDIAILTNLKLKLPCAIIIASIERECWHQTARKKAVLIY